MELEDRRYFLLIVYPLQYYPQELCGVEYRKNNGGRMMKAVVASNLTKKFRNLVAVDSVSFSVAEGEVLGLLGPNGAGKSTTIRLLSTLIKPTSGTASVFGYDICTDPDKVRACISLVTDRIILYERLTAFENLVFFARLAGLPKEEANRRSINLLEEVNMIKWKDKQVRFFSSGMKQRINVARALINHPRILFLDEPTIGLDPRSTSNMRKLISSLKENGQSVILTTHLIHDAEILCDRILLIHTGNIIASGTFEELRSLVRRYNDSEPASLEDVYLLLMPE
ncbi:MAG: Daunorubicin resistance ABC transporter ATPase subunit [Thermotogales bacterium 46_20]|nr:MAG: Daunorubicin resistance ABC transporter ATPase subunit [Thermotogales bacterium 46_20]